MLSINLGPLALPLMPLLLMGAVWAAAALASRQAPAMPAGEPAPAAARLPSPSKADAAQAVYVAAGLGLLAARLAYLALHARAYAATPLALLDLRDGGWFAPAGWLVGAAWMAWRAHRSPVLRRALTGAALVLAAFALATVAAQRLQAAATLPELSLIDLDTGAARTLLQAADGRPAVVNLWATWCAPCRAEMPTLAAAQLQESGVAFVFVNQGEAPHTALAWLASQGLPLRNVLLDAHNSLGPAVGSRGLPTTLFYDAQGRQVDAHFGVLNAAALESRLQRLRPTP